ncbi:MAG: ATP-binding cassette domain-containing protein [Nocardiopsaceae bacterium]|jgi:iron complex transport system ATP-binding protein|nr:ATP-binding cassette domain-containing protein [Nocardiopsaceae bacterium]
MDNVIEARGVDLVRDGRLLLDQISMSVREGDLWALLGPNGAGKSVLLRLLATYSHPTRGHVEILGKRLGQVDVFTLRPLVSLVSAHHPVRPARTLRELVLTGATGTLDLAARWTPSPCDSAKADEVIALMGLGRLAGSRWRLLSQGERSRALIARALMGSPRILLLDEPAAGLDVAGREQLLASLTDLRVREPDLAVILVTHHLEELPPGTSHALLLRQGRQLAAGPVAEVLTSDLVSACFGHPVAVSRHAGRWICTARSSDIEMAPSQRA